MVEDPRTTVTRVLRESVAGPNAGFSEGASAASGADRLFPLLYPELRRLAGRFIRSEPQRHAIQTTSLLHEAYLKLVDQSAVGGAGRTQFFHIAAQAMRRILVDHARKLKRLKRGGGQHRIQLSDSVLSMRSTATFDAEDLVALDAALTKLSGLDARQAQCVELRFFSDMSVEQVAAVQGGSARSVERDWTHAKAWLRREIEASSGFSPGSSSGS